MSADISSYFQLPTHFQRMTVTDDFLVGLTFKGGFFSSILLRGLKAGGLNTNTTTLRYFTTFCPQIPDPTPSPTTYHVSHIYYGHRKKDQRQTVFLFA